MRAPRCGVPVRSTSSWPQCSRATAVEAVALDQLPHRRRDESRTSSPRARRARSSREETACGSSSKKSTRSGASSRRAPRRAARAGSPGRVATPSRDQPQHLVRLLPAGEADELVGAEQEDRVVPLRVVAQHVDRARVLVEHDLVARERRAGELEPHRAPASRPACARDRRRRATSTRSSPSAAFARRAASATWPSCGGSNAPPKSPITATNSNDLVADLDLGAAARARPRGARARAPPRPAACRRRGSRGRCAAGASARAFGSGR